MNTTLPLPRGRVDWTAPAGHTTVYTTQHRSVVEQLREHGRYEHTADTRFDHAAFAPAYAWMREAMRTRLHVPMTGTWPVWGWTKTHRYILVDRRGRTPDDRLMRLVVPDELLLQSDYFAWHSPLSDAPLVPPEIPVDSGEWHARYEALQGPRHVRARRAGWDRIFDLDAWPTPHHVQAVMPFLCADWVVWSRAALPGC